MSERVVVIAHMRAKPGQETALRELCLSLCAPTRAETGCINYDVHESLERPGEFMFHETWASAEALEKHLTAPHVQSALERAAEIVEVAPEITAWRRVGLAQAMVH